ncbi:MAG: M20 aminoacylase family protein [Rhodocyclaceae bacterium]
MLSHDFPSDIVAAATGWRRDFHAHPELGFREARTSARIAELLQSFGLEVDRGLGGTGVVGTLRCGDGPSIGLRADMDALPMQELGEVAHCSVHPGCMHACGHDGHSAILLAAAAELARSRRFRGTVHFVFQPAEENLGGARRMIADGLFERFPMQAIYGLHNWPGLPLGQVAVNPGPMMASLDTFEVVINGSGCHAAMPERGIDPVVVATQLVGALQTIVSRRIAATDSAVLSVTRIEAGEAINVIPQTASLSGTVRCLQESARAEVERLMADMLAHLPEAYGASARFEYRRGYPVTCNHAAEAGFARDVALEVVGAPHVTWGCRPSMASEDFAFMLEACPGAYLWLGVDGATPSAALHNPGYDFNDDAIGIGARLWCALVERALPVDAAAAAG